MARAVLGKKAKRKTKSKSRSATGAITAARRVSAANLLSDMMSLAPDAIKFKKDLMKDPDCPKYLKLANANDILDRTVPKPDKNINIRGSLSTSGLSDRELKEVMMKKLAEKGIIDVSPDDYSVDEEE